VETIIEVDLATNAGLIPSVLAPKGKVVIYGTSKLQSELPAFFCPRSARGGRAEGGSLKLAMARRNRAGQSVGGFIE
jgi:hypothetical protein